MHTIPKKPVYIPTLINNKRSELRNKQTELSDILNTAILTSPDAASQRIHGDLLEIITRIYGNVDDILSEIAEVYDNQHRMGNQTCGG